MNLLLTAGVVGGLLALPLIGSGIGSAEAITVGSEPSYTFREAPVNSMGIQSLDAMRGKPVLVEFWGPN